MIPKNYIYKKTRGKMINVIHRFNANIFPMIRDRFFLHGTMGLCGLIWLFVSATSVFAWDSSKDNWALLGGYGQSLPGWGRTTQRVETIDLVPRYSHMTFDDLGSGWFKGFHSTLIELPMHVVTSPDTSAMVGVNLLACYTFTANDDWRPYIFGGGGPV